MIWNSWTIYRQRKEFSILGKNCFILFFKSQEPKYIYLAFLAQSSPWNKTLSEFKNFLKKPIWEILQVNGVNCFSWKSEEISQCVKWKIADNFQNSRGKLFNLKACFATKAIRLIDLTSVFTSWWKKIIFV